MSCLSSETFTDLKRRRFLLFLIATMIASFLLIFLIHASFSKDIPPNHHPQRNELHELKLVHVVSNFSKFQCQSKMKVFFYQFFRHGARTPADTYPNDIHLNETFWPYGWGQLTNVSVILNLLGVKNKL